MPGGVLLSEFGTNKRMLAVEAMKLKVQGDRMLAAVCHLPERHMDEFLQRDINTIRETRRRLLNRVEQRLYDRLPDSAFEDEDKTAILEEKATIRNTEEPPPLTLAM